MNMNEINKLSDRELEKLLLEKRAAVRQFRFDITGSKAKNVNDGSNMRKDVARILTALSLRDNK
ncbi:MAG: 50S ribosomal protein L29 [Candidatus Lloydbacteria bacterium RIFCSPHIGHO2_02_FULL_54_17]|uniref:Large ribosomal subunit protein uL29 n=1 Tax=Candidatus Lloydbacteria bacterium RIFCSPHIGHO2_02_FULL_54_17 TaxID=1798664 RepID=A0A1G2DEX2_9BACT|nr:MAG: 50S ribosomal protein L29 [Candidatus Lloydbacteria bacterium RIFCSPHIGHO2_01_FULL_54_11]OGZ12159.1 MAG: 50S ribosomal protein L29 [Candidatus Lloydbacteria bacterium RIFCSPHIGHO2_02_FULL_54_17]OGZ12950.1 MAG: 50S ribosomal protein L29 [Candidatus Lloydbacteria bacterium RIFCSPLOWO2_01_FULL_54_18]OGZ15948.1 MAG: 50S ribosomal protein L29 [Candidatus Lloydbacteria bacterium RIFCSPLOWO2_02_FULL_54_12]